MDNIIFDTCKYCLGDEMSMTRNYILDLLINNYITNDVVIYCVKDRNFFYENILDKKIRITNNNIFNYHKINYYNSKNHSDEFKKLVTNINYLEVLPKFNNETFIVYHHRYKNDGAWDSKESELNAILKKKNHNIVIFSQSDLDYLNCNQNVYFTKNLKEYASFIHSNNCLAVVSVWSGGGQLASYCSNANTKLIMYFDKCQGHYGSCNEKCINSENAFDYAQFTDVKRIFVKESDLENYYNYL